MLIQIGQMDHKVKDSRKILPTGLEEISYHHTPRLPNIRTNSLYRQQLIRSDSSNLKIVDIPVSDCNQYAIDFDN